MCVYAVIGITKYTISGFDIILCTLYSKKKAAQLHPFIIIKSIPFKLKLFNLILCFHGYLILQNFQNVTLC